MKQRYEIFTRRGLYFFQFKLLEPNAVNCSAIDYSETHGTLVFGDTMGQIVLCSIQNPRRIFAMSRKGYQPTVLVQTDIKVKKGEFSVNFASRRKLNNLLTVKEKVKDHTKAKVTEGLGTFLFCGNFRSNYFRNKLRSNLDDYKVEWAWFEVDLASCWLRYWTC